MTTVPVRRALLSVSDKSGLVPFAQRLVAAGVEIVSSGGTARALSAEGVPVRAVEEVTGSPEMLDGRVKTLHPRIHGGILADTTNPAHVADLDANGIEPFQLVVSNLYPFRETVATPGATRSDIVEQIDIGGPAMVRAAAKNHACVGIVTDPSMYDEVAAAVEAGGLDDELRLRLAGTAFFHTAAYDAAIVNWLEGSDTELPGRRVLALERADVLRYGENPHQRGARYREAAAGSWWDDVVQHAGLPLSYLNLFDAAAAWEAAHSLPTDGHAVVIVKHANPCGAAIGADQADTYRRAYECDSRSAFGGIVAFSDVVGPDSVAVLEEAAQADVVIAPGYADGVVDRIVARRKNTRVLEAPAPTGESSHLRQISGGWLLQDAYRFESDDWTVVTERAPTEGEWADARFAWRVCGLTTSNAIVLAKDGTAWGIGAGQQNRVESGSIAVEKAAGRAVGGACASDAFFPFPDGLDAAAAAGAAVVVQPGGAVRDADVIERANELGLAMVVTGERQFRH